MNRFTRTLLFICIHFLFAGVASAQVTAAFTSNTVAGCAPLVVQFTNTSTGNYTTSSWNFGNGNPPSAQTNPSTSYTTCGTYTVSLTVSGPGGSNTHSVTNYITVYCQPVVTFTANNTAGCPCTTVQFTSNITANAPGAVTYAWDFGDGSTSAASNPSHPYCTSGLYSVTLVVTNSNGCSKTVTMANYINIYAPPSGSFSAGTTTLCHTPAAVTFTNNATGTGPLTTSWTFGDGGTGTGNTATHNYNASGTYTVTAITTDAHGCKDTVVQPAFISATNSSGSFTGPTSACLYDSVTFFNTSVGSFSSIWSFGDGSNSADFNAGHKYATPGTYTVRLIATVGGCLDTVTHTILVRTPPPANFTGTPLQPCPAPATVTFTSTAPTATSYTWDFGDLGSSPSANPVHTYNQNGSYDVKLIVTDANGCTDTVKKPHYVNIANMILIAYGNPTLGCAPLSVNFSSVLASDTPSSANYPVPVTSYNWDFADGFTSMAATPTHVFNTAGVYHVRLITTTANGCTDTTYLNIAAGSHPTAGFTAAPLVQCADQPVHFTNTSIGYNSLLWLFGDGLSASTTGNTDHRYHNPGTYTVRLVAFNNGCPDTLTRNLYITINPSSALFADSIYCPPSKNVLFKNLSIGATSQMWDFGDGFTSIASGNITHTYTAYGTYTVRLVTFNNVFGCSDTMTQNVALIPPQSSFTVSDTTICKGDTISLIGVYPGQAQAFSWKVDGSYYIDTLSTILYHFTTTGFHTIQFTAIDANGCYDSVTRSNYVLVARPVAGFQGSPPIGCTPLNVTFTDTTHYTVSTFPVNRSWTYGDGGSLTNNAATSLHPYLSAGIYDVSLIVTDNIGCSDTLTKSAYIDARHPTADFAPDDTTACFGQVVSFTNNSYGTGALNYAWTFGDGGSTGALNPTHAYHTAGNFTVKLIVTDATGCADSTTHIINVSKPVAAFTLSDTLAICPPLLVHFTNNSTGAATWDWKFGNNGVSTLQNPVNTFTAPGNYTIRLIAINVNGCTDTAFAHVYVLGYAGALTYSPLIGCDPLTVNFTASITNVPNLIWDFSDGTTQPAAGANASHIYTVPGAYVPKLIFSDGMGCVSSSTGLDTIKVDAIIAGFKVTTPCENATATLVDTSHSFFSHSTAWTWHFDNGQTSTAAQPTHVFGPVGTYPVTFYVTDGIGCRDSVTENVTVYPLPVISAGRDTAVCPGDAVALYASGGVTYLWTPSATVSCATCAVTLASPTTPTKYIVFGGDVHGCVGTDTAVVTIQTKTTDLVVHNAEVCIGSGVQLSVTGAATYLWTPAATLSNATSGTPVATPAANTTYMVIAKEGSCLPDTEYVQVVVHPKPVVHAGSSRTIIEGNSVSLLATGTGAVSYAWAADSSLSCTACTDPTARPVRTTTYVVTGTSSFGCEDSDHVTINVLCDGGQVFIPNTFTPNGDGNNDRFFAHGVGISRIISFRIYSRWGEVLYDHEGGSINDEHIGWDGTKNGGAILPPDVYVYVLDAECDSGEPLHFKGDVTLLR